MGTIEGKELIGKLCEALGVSPERVYSVTLNAEEGAAVMVTVARFVTDQELNELYTLFEYYGLVKQGEFKQAHPGTMAHGEVVPEADDEWSRLGREHMANKEKEG